MVRILHREGKERKGKERKGKGRKGDEAKRSERCTYSISRLTIQ